MAELAAATEAPNTTLEFETLRDRLDYLAQLDGAEDEVAPFVSTQPLGIQPLRVPPSSIPL